MENPVENNVTASLALGTWIGRGQAFGLIAYKSLAAKAQALLEVKESGAYKILGLDWDQFCPQHVGLTRRQVDSIIQNLKEFGETYFQLKEIVTISPEAYRQIAPKIQAESIEIDGEMVRIVPENAVRIRDVVNRLRVDLRKAQDDLRHANDDIDILTTPEIAGLQARMDSCFYELRCMAPGLAAKKQHDLLRALVQRGMNILNEISRNWLQ